LSSICVHNRQRGIRVDREQLQAFAERVLWRASKLRPSISLPPINILLISDRRMSEIHLRFLKEAGPTDVITFQHGEIFVSAETARRQGWEFKTSTFDEIQLYIVHGLLHLLGFDDKTEAQARVMRKKQTQVLRAARKT
jgi:probable rRNA maturation factor